MDEEYNSDIELEMLYMDTKKKCNTCKNHIFYDVHFNIPPQEYKLYSINISKIYG
jgi:hypothetical protein